MTPAAQQTYHTPTMGNEQTNKSSTSSVAFTNLPSHNHLYEAYILVVELLLVLRPTVATEKLLKAIMVHYLQVRDQLTSAVDLSIQPKSLFLYYRLNIEKYIHLSPLKKYFYYVNTPTLKRMNQKCILAKFVSIFKLSF
jgi:hypothetical protein